MGKKWGAWYFAFAYASYVRSAVRVVLQDSKEKTPGSILQHVNQSVYQDAKVSEVFATLSVLVLNNKSKTVKYTGAGDLPVICCLASNGGIKKVKSNGTLLGFAANGNYDDISIEMKPGDCLFLVTDGIIETRNAEGEQFGARKLDEVIKNLSPDDDPLETIKKEFVNYTERKFEDDISLITIKCKD
jgi:sigma-B regulation protein RsbU (phosphoserine phosphatase)